jgi:SNF2 family DNA or RNA helicase
MSEEARYLIFLTEQFAASKGLSGSQVFILFKEKGLLPYIHDMFYTYHTERVENAIEDIGRMLERNKKRHETIMPELTFSRGDRVRDTYTGKPGFITGKIRPFGESVSWQVGFGDSETVFIRESYLELISDDDDMFSLFEQCRFNGVMDLRRIIQQIRLEGKLTNIFYSMHNSSTKFMPHQFKPVMKFIESATGRLLIADEVGLGKTIEAIYIWKELLTRENAKHFLIVCPAQLCQKWKNDLMHYFGIPSMIVGAKDLLDRLKESLMNYNSDNFVLITSIQGIRYREKENDVMTDMLYEDMGLEEEDEIPPETLEDNLPIKINDELISQFTKSDSKFITLLSIIFLSS